MKPLRAVIVEDEPIVRRAFRRMLSEFPQVRICGEAESVEQAATLIWETNPDVVYLDIELFGEKGFDLVPQIDEHVAIVFVTAFDHYALRAFEINALDYLVKPVSKERLAESIQRLSGGGAAAPRSSIAEKLDLNDVILVQSHKRRHMVPLQNVCAIESDGGLSILHSIDGINGIVWRSLNEWERILPEGPFARIHRRRVINLNHIKSFETVSGRCLRIHLSGAPEPYHASRRLSPALRKRLQTKT